jgi:hypothetical protein
MTRVYRLTPVYLTDLDWQASTHRGEAIVRAASEAEARDLATRAFTARGVAQSPWNYAYAVEVRVLDDGHYPAEGPPGVLEPAAGAHPAHGRCEGQASSAGEAGHSSASRGKSRDRGRTCRHSG